MVALWPRLPPPLTLSSPGGSGNDELQQQVLELKQENEELKLWRQRRTDVDDQMGGYTVGDLKVIAKKDGLTVGGTKAQLMMRLVEAGSLQLDEK